MTTLSMSRTNLYWMNICKGLVTISHLDPLLFVLNYTGNWRVAIVRSISDIETFLTIKHRWTPIDYIGSDCYSTKLLVDVVPLFELLGFFSLPTASLPENPITLST